MSPLKPVQTVKENYVGCYMKRTKKYRIWFQAASELIKRKENMSRDTFYVKALAGVF